MENEINKISDLTESIMGNNSYYYNQISEIVSNYKLSIEKLNDIVTMIDDLIDSFNTSSGDEITTIVSQLIDYKNEYNSLISKITSKLLAINDKADEYTGYYQKYCLLKANDTCIYDYYSPNKDQDGGQCHCWVFIYDVRINKSNGLVQTKLKTVQDNYDDRNLGAILNWFTTQKEIIASTWNTVSEMIDL